MDCSESLKKYIACLPMNFDLVNLKNAMLKCFNCVSDMDSLIIY